MSVRAWWTRDAELTMADRPDAAAPPRSGELLETAVYCNNARIEADEGGWKRTGDPTESALLMAAEQLGIDVPAAQTQPSRSVQLRLTGQADDDDRRRPVR
jgi:magnesium-transporting ATPase (P-type)